MDITGMSEKEYRWFVKEALLHSKLRPGEPTMDFGVSLAIAIIGVALSVAGSLLAPKPRQQQQQNREQRQIGGQDFVSGQRFGPTSGFDSVQNVVELGSTIPLVYAKRTEVIDADGTKTYYGGVRVNTNLLWSQLFSVGGGQLFRGIFLISEGVIAQPDPMQFAIGNNLLSTFDLEQSDTSRLSIYFTDGSRPNNRIVDGDFIAGRLPALDLGNLDPDNVFAARGAGDLLNSNFVFASTPSNQTTFGVGTFIGNALSYRVNPRIVPADNFETGSGDTTTNRQRSAERRRDESRFQGRSGIISITKADGSVPTFKSSDFVKFDEGDTFTYSIFNQSDFDGDFRFGEGSGRGEVDTADIAQAVASRQNSYDDAIQLGDRYLAGTATAVCIDRDDFAFNSEVSNNPVRGGNRVNATFKVIKEGVCNVFEESEINAPLLSDSDTGGDGNQPRKGPDINATRDGHLMRASEAFIATERKTKFVEVGFRSTVNLQLNGICAWQNIDKDYEEIDRLNRRNNSFYTNPTYTSAETRYSFFKVRYKKAMDPDFTDVRCYFAIRSLSSSPVYNYLRFEFPTQDLWEIQFIPVSGFEARQRYIGIFVDSFLDGFASYQESSLPVGPNRTQIENNDDIFYKNDTEEYPSGQFGNDADFYVKEGEGVELPIDSTAIPINVLDYKNNNRELTTIGDLTFRYSGEANIPNTVDTFGVQVLSENEDSDQLNGFDDEGENDEGNTINYHADAFARMAEAFIFDEFSSTASNPEHQIVYVNTQTDNGAPPQYSNLALIGLNIRSSTEINQLQQFSVYVESGINDTNRFPDVLFDLLTNERYGTGSILNPQQIDQASFNSAAEFCERRLYFFDGIIDEKLNIRSWAAQTAQAFLLDFVIRNGKFALQPAVNFDVPETIRGLFTAGNIIEDTFELSFADEQDRIPPRVQVRWREEKPDQDKGLFPLIRQVTVREAGTPDSAPLEQIDASAFATSEKHAIDVAKFICRTKRLVTHSVRFATTPTENVLDIGSVFKLGLETVNFEQPQNGAITSTGEVTAWPPLADGTYDVLLWDGSNLQETTITVVEGNSEPAGSVFCLRDTTASTQTYKAQSLSFNEDGNIEVEATFFPTNDSGFSLIASGFDIEDNWIIEGRINTNEPEENP